MEEILISINGKFCNPQNAKISIFDRGFLYGDSVYEVTRSYEGIPFLLEEHLDRLWRSASLVGMDLTTSKEEISKNIYQCIEMLKIENVYIRIIVTRGEGPLDLDPTIPTKNNVIIIAKKQLPNPSWWYEKGVSFIITNVLKIPKKTIDPNCKSGNYLPNIMAMKEAKEAGAFDAMMLNHKGYITEGTTNNSWMIDKKNTIITPPLKAGILQGLTREVLIQLIKKKKLDFEERNFTPEEIMKAKEVFLTSSTKEIVPITKIDNVDIADGKPGKITKKLILLYSSFIKEYSSKRINH